ncbi:MAG TPA: CRTAC1 family protein [Thermoanaerobaculia bacterium]|nr:CRTAC1 family protein [Thermoanaerobaculia bacterium]
MNLPKFHWLRRKPVFFGLTLGPLALLVGGLMTLDHLDREGKAFFETGRAAVGTLDRLAGALSKGDLAAAGDLYAADFHGSPLGLTGLQPKGRKDGIETLRFALATTTTDRAAALDEWRAYLDGFQSVEEIGLHLHRVKEWETGGDVTAEVRFETIGTPRGRVRPGIDRALFRMRFVPGPAGPRIAEASLVEGERLLADRAQFENVAHPAGIDFMNRYYPPLLTQPLRFGMIRHGPGGISAADLDNDGFYDLFVPDGAESRLFRNRRDGTFEDVTAAAGLTGLDGVSVGVFADYDNDGFKDLFVSRTFKPNQLFHNRGDGTFEDVTARAGIGEDCCTTVASWGDYDNDGRLDLYVGRYLDPRTKIPTTFYARNGEPNQLYHNDGDGTFTNVTEAAGVGDTGLCLGSAWGDYDDDGDADLYVVNDFGRSTLYRNEGGGTFTDVTVDAGTLAYGAGMSASFGDYDNDGRLDLYVADIRSEHGWFAEPPTVWRYMANSWKQGVWRTDMPLYFQIFRQSGTRFVEVFQEMAAGNHLLRNRGDGTFEDVSWKTGTNPIGWFWGSGFGDFDNDGFQDIYSANGWVYNDKGTEIEMDFLNNVVGDQAEYKKGTFFDPKHFGKLSWHGWERNRHLLNRGDGTFAEIGRPAGTDLLTNSRGIALADFWNRGVLDIAVAASADRHALLRNEVGQGRHWLEVELAGTKSNRGGVGARVTVRAGGKTLTREVTAGDGYASQSMLRLHFGLGAATTVQELTVKWPASGTVQSFRNVPANRIVQVTEGGEMVEKTYGAAAR